MAPTGAPAGTTLGGDGLLVEEVGSAEGLRQLRPRWHQLEVQCEALNPFLTWEWQWSWWESFGSGLEAHFLVVTEGDALLGLAPFCSDPERPLQLTLGGGLELTDHLGFLHLPGREREVAGAILDWAQGRLGPEGSLELHYLPADSPSLAGLRAAAKARGMDVQERVEKVSPRVELPVSFEDYLAGCLDKKDRHELRRKFRRLDQERPGWTTVSQEEVGLGPALDSFLRMLAASGETKQAFLTPQVAGFFRAVGERLQERGWLRIRLLVAGEESLAATYGFTLEGVWYLYNSGYEPSQGALSPGLLCVAEGIRTAIAEGCHRADLLRGDEPYKYRLGAVDRDLVQLTVAAAGTGAAR